MKNFVIIFVLILIIFFFYKSDNNSTVNNTLNNADSSFVCPTPEEFWQNYINMRDSSEKFSDYAKQISAQCTGYFRSTSAPDCERLYSFTNLYFTNKISRQEVLDLTQTLNGKCKAQSDDIQSMIMNKKCIYSMREHKCY